MTEKWEKRFKAYYFAPDTNFITDRFLKATDSEAAIVKAKEMIPSLDRDYNHNNPCNKLTRGHLFIRVEDASCAIIF